MHDDDTNDRFDRQPLNEISLSRVASHIKDRPFALLTAFRFKDKQTGELISLQTNRSNNAKLENDIRSAGFGFVKMLGRYEEDYGDKKVKVTEESFMVIGRDNSPAQVGAVKGFAKRMGQKFGQDCVLFKDPNRKDAVLIGTRADAWPGMNVVAPIGEFSPMKLDGIYTQLVKGRNSPTARGFKFESIEYPLSIMEIWAKKIQRKLKESDYERDSEAQEDLG
jgi:hypothetical protein